MHACQQVHYWPKYLFIFFRSQNFGSINFRVTLFFEQAGHRVCKNEGGAMNESACTIVFRTSMWRRQKQRLSVLHVASASINTWTAAIEETWRRDI